MDDINSKGGGGGGGVWLGGVLLLTFQTPDVMDDCIY